MTTATVQDTRHIRDMLSLEFLQELQNAHPAKPPPRPQGSASIKSAIARWLNEEL